ncbi:unnamed protein product, partial [Ectocarpus fasciculatus]
FPCLRNETLPGACGRAQTIFPPRRFRVPLSTMAKTYGSEKVCLATEVLGTFVLIRRQTRMGPKTQTRQPAMKQAQREYPYSDCEENTCNNNNLRILIGGIVRLPSKDGTFFHLTATTTTTPT